MRMIRLLIMALLLALPSLSARAQVAPDQARQALDVLQDPQKRQTVIDTLQAIVHAQPAPAPASAPATPPAAEPAPAAAPPPAAPAAPTIAPNSLGAQVLVSGSHLLNHVSNEALAGLGAIRSVPLLWMWLNVMATEPWARQILLDTLWRLAVVLACSLAAEWIIGLAVRRPVLAMAARAPNGQPPPPDETGEARAEIGETEPPHRRRLAALTLLRRMPLVFARLCLELLPVLGFLGVGHVVAATPLGGDGQPRLILLAVIDAYALCAGMLCLARVMFSPVHQRLRLFHISDASAAYAMRWIRRIVVVSVFGYAIAEVGLLLGLSDTAHEALLKFVGLIDHIFMAIIVLQRRRTVRRLIRAPEGSSGPIAALRNWLARVWHWLAIMLLAAFWITWAVEVPHGYARMFQYVLSVVIVAVVARLAQILILGALDRALAPREGLAAHYPGIEVRLALYHPVLISTARALIAVAAVFLLLQLWGLGAVDWLLGSTLGKHLISSLVMLAITLLLSIAVWEAINAAIERHLARLTREAQAARSARLRTLLPLLRTTLTVTIVVVAGMMVLSEIGVNIGPLLAGAGIVGVAIGFGSQKLVQDLITGIFLLLENAMQVGDSVTVAGLSGTVENLSIRTLRLRAGDGSVHIIPFSSVTTVNNVNRGLGNAAVSVSVALHEDTDRVCDTLKQVAAEMRADADFSGRMLSDLQLFGVDKVDGASATITGQVVCTDSGRWSVQREFNRRMKRRFEELAIELYNPVQRMVAMRQADERNDDER